MTHPADAPSPRRSTDVLVLALTALVLGAAAGAIAACTYLAMIWVQTVIWTAVGPGRWVILPLTVAGGALIGLAQRNTAGPELEAQLAGADNPEHIHRRESFWIAVSAIIAVGFGGAIGPEAGLLAVTMQLSAFVSVALGRKASERSALTRAGASGALAGFYGTPLGGPVHVVPEGQMPRPILFLAGFAGFAAFVLTAEFLRAGAISMMWLPRLTATPGRWDAFIALLPAAAGSMAGLFYLWARATTTRLLDRHVPTVALYPLLGGLGLGLICTALPILLFSGHNEIHEMLELGATYGAGLLVLLGFGKALACAICIGSHWKGGLIFPLCFAGAALGAATLSWLPGLDPVMGVAAGMAAAAAVGMARPILAGLVMIFVLGAGLSVPVAIGAFVGWAVLHLVPESLRGPVQH